MLNLIFVQCLNVYVMWSKNFSSGRLIHCSYFIQIKNVCLIFTILIPPEHPYVCIYMLCANSDPLYCKIDSIFQKYYILMCHVTQYFITIYLRVPVSFYVMWHVLCMCHKWKNWLGGSTYTLKIVKISFTLLESIELCLLVIAWKYILQGISVITTEH